MNTTHKDLNPLNKIAKNIKEINGVNPSPTPTPTGSNVHVYVLEFNYEDREEHNDGYYIDVDSNIKATILNDYQTYGQDHCYFAKIVMKEPHEPHELHDVMFVPISFYDLNRDPYPDVEYECQDYTTAVYFYDDYIKLDRYDTQSYQYTQVSITGGTLQVDTKSDVYQDGEAVGYLFAYIVNNYRQNTKLYFSNRDTSEYCMLTCNFQGDNPNVVVFTGKVANKPIALIIYNDDDKYGWKLIGRTLEVTAHNGGLEVDRSPVTYKDFYEELSLCYEYNIPFELELKMNKVTINNQATDLIFNKWDYVNNATNQRVHVVSTIIHQDGYAISVDILIQDTSSQVMYNIITL